MYVDGSSYSTSTDMMSVMGALAGVFIVIWLVTLVVSIVILVAMWKIFKKAGRPGWAALIPFYNTYTLFDIVYGNGWRMLFMLIPFFNIYIGIKLYIDLAHIYGQSTAFGIGLLFFCPIFLCILGFGSAQYTGNGYVAEPQPKVVASSSSGMSDEDMRAALREKMNRR